MTLIERYVLKIAGAAFLSALGVLTAVIWLTQAMRDFDLMTTKGQSILVFFHITGLIIPSLVMVIAPIALFIATIFSLNRLNGDSELVVTAAAGLSPFRLFRPFAVLMTATAIFSAFISHLGHAGQFPNHARRHQRGAGGLPDPSRASRRVQHAGVRA